MKEILLNVNGMSCHHCEMRINNELLNKNGVHECKSDAKKSEVAIKFDESKVSLEEIKNTISEIGYIVK